MWYSIDWKIILYSIVSHKKKHVIAIQPSNWTPDNLSQKNEALYPQKNLYRNVQRNSIFNIQNLKSVQMSFKKWMVKQTVVHSYHRLLRTNEKGTHYLNTQHLGLIPQEITLSEISQSQNVIHYMIPSILYLLSKITKIPTIVGKSYWQCYGVSLCRKDSCRQYGKIPLEGKYSSEKLWHSFLGTGFWGPSVSKPEIGKKRLNWWLELCLEKLSLFFSSLLKCHVTSKGFPDQCILKNQSSTVTFCTPYSMFSA